MVVLVRVHVGHLWVVSLLAGTFGQYQGSSPDLYMSRDGGMTWFQVCKTKIMHIYDL